MLAADENRSVRERVAGNPNTPAEALTRLAVDAETEVRAEARQHPRYGDLPEETLVEAALLDG